MAIFILLLCLPVSSCQPQKQIPPSRTSSYQDYFDATALHTPLVRIVRDLALPKPLEFEARPAGISIERELTPEEREGWRELKYYVKE